MRAEYSESNNSKMIGLVLLPLTHLNYTTARELDHDDESTVLKYTDDAIGRKFESSSVGGTPVCYRLDQVLDSINMEYSRSVRRKGLAEERKGPLKSGIDSSSIGMAFQW
jgi:hypothetical protein